MSDLTEMAMALSERLAAHKKAKQRSGKVNRAAKPAVEKKLRTKTKPRATAAPSNGGWTPEQIQRFNDETNRAYQMILSGATRQEAADAVGLTLTQLRGRMQNRGLRMPEAGDRDERHAAAARARQMYEGGATPKEAAAAIGWTVRQLHRYWNRHGMTSAKRPGFEKRHADAVYARKLYEEGMTVEEAAVAVGRSVRSLYSYWTKYGMCGGKYGRKQVDIETRAAFDAIEAGSTLAAEAEKLGIHKDTLRGRFEARELLTSVRGYHRQQREVAAVERHKLAIRARELYETGMPTAEAAVAAEWPGSPAGLRKYWSRHNMCDDQHKTDRINAVVRKAFDAIEVGSTFAAEAEKVGCDKKTLRDWFKACGLVTTSQKKYREQQKARAEAVRGRKLPESGMSIDKVAVSGGDDE